VSGPIITTTRAGLTYRAELGDRHVTIVGESADEATNHLRAARELRRDLGLAGGLHGRDEGEGQMTWSVGWVRPVNS
jgi:hypothetical protein